MNADERGLKVMELEHKEITKAELEAPAKVRFKGYVIGDYFADLLVEDKVIVELKVAGISVGLLINFGRQKVEFKRFAYSEKSAVDLRSSAAD